LALSTISVAPAQADDGGIRFDITSIQASDYAVRSGGCHSVPVTATHNAPASVDDIDMRTEVWRGSKYIETISLSEDGPGQLSGEIFYCPFLYSVGTFRLGPSEIDWSSFTSDDFLTGQFNDSTTASLAIKQATAISKPKWKKRGRGATVTTKGRWFSLDSSSWQHDPKGIVNNLQRRSDSNHGWKTIKSARSNKKGVATFKIKSKPTKRMQYRVMQKSTKYSLGATSPSIRR
jgi:hypothetical protein